jgi:hypothetical protein
LKLRLIKLTQFSQQLFNELETQLKRFNAPEERLKTWRSDSKGRREQSVNES